MFFKKVTKTQINENKQQIIIKKMKKSKKKQHPYIPMKKEQRVCG